MEDLRPRRYVRMSTETEQLFEDVVMTPEDAGDVNEKLAADGERYRWVPYGTREGEGMAA